MREFLLVLSLLAAAESATAHGCGGFRAPGFMKKGIPCVCAKIDCSKCSTPALRTGKDISRRGTDILEVARWGDITKVRATMTFETARERGAMEGYTRIKQAGVFAVVSGRIESLNASRKPRPGGALIATLQPSERARSTYLWERRRACLDPLLVLRRGPGEVHVRAFPISKTAPLRVVIEAYTLLPREGANGVRLYRTGSRYLAVLADGKYRFLTEKECRKRYGAIAARVVPCVPQLEAAATGRGDAAASEDVALAAFPPGAKPAPFVGSDVFVFDIPPGLRRSADPPPPLPPPPSTPTATPRETPRAAVEPSALEPPPTAKKP